MANSLVISSWTEATVAASGTAAAGGGSYTLAARAGVRLVGFGTTWFVG